MSDSMVIILTGAFVAGSCALLGSFLVLRKLSMLGDAISHAVLPGIVIAFLVTSSRSSLPMFIGAALVGVLTAFLVQFLSHRGVQGDAAIGVTFTTLFAIGVILVSQYGSTVDLDLECVLYGEIAYTPFDVIFVGDDSIGARALWVNGGLFLLNLAFVLAFYKQLKLSAFDPELAAAVGIPVTAFHYMLMGLVSVTTVGSFESVGAILVVAMIIVPAATAYLLSENLARMIGLAVLLGALSSVFGYEIASAIDCSIAGAMASVAGFLFSLALLFAPGQGIVARAMSQRGLRRQVAEEDVLLWATRQRELVAMEGFTMSELRDTHPDEIERLTRGLTRLIRRGLLAVRDKGYELTTKGREEGIELLRRHRLYESFLGDKLGYDTDHLHDPADRVEHYISPDDTTEIERVTEYPDRDPQGRPIPPSQKEKESS